MPRRRLIAGENLNRSISAGTWNDLLSLLDYRDRNGLWAPRAGIGANHPVRPPHPTAFLVRNDTGSPIDRFALVALDGPLVDDSQTSGEFDREVVMSAIDASANRTKPMAVAIDALPYNECGYAVATGIVQCLVDITDADMTHCSFSDGEPYAQGNYGGPWRIVWMPGTGSAQKCLVNCGDPLYIRKARSTSTITASGSGTANVYLDGASVGSVTVYYDWMTGGGNIGTTTDLLIEYFPDQDKWVVIGAECGA